MEMIALEAQQRAEQRHERGADHAERADAANKPAGTQLFSDRTPLR